MAGQWTRLSPGRWRNTATGQTVNSDTDPSKAGPQWKGKPTPAKTPAAAPAASSGNPLLAQLTAAENAYKSATGAAKAAALEKLKQVQQQVAAAGIDPKTGSSTPMTPEQKQDAAISNLVGPGQEGAQALSSRLFPEGSLGRMDYQGPEGRAITASYKSNADRFASMTPSADVQDIISRYKTSLDGYTSSEQTALRESAMRGIDSSYATASRRAATQGAASGVKGGAAVADRNRLNRERINAQGNLEQDLFIKNADEKQRRLGDYANLIGNVENTNYERATGSLDAYANQYGRSRADDVATKAYNDQRVADETAGRYGTYFGALNLGLQNQAQAEDFALNNEYLKIAKKRYGSSGSKKASTSSTPSAPATNPYYAEAIKLIQGS